MKVLDLFSGIGGFSLGLEKAGMETVLFCELSSSKRKILQKHWPSVTAHDDIRTLKVNHGSADVICGGFPCQDISPAGKRAGIRGKQSGLWSEYFRIICEVLPHFVIVENSSMLVNSGIGVVVGDLASIGYDAEWDCIPASAIGAPHVRDRTWIIAYPAQEQRIHQSYLGQATKRLLAHQTYWQANPWDASTPALCRMDDGIPNRVDRTEWLGDAIIPEIAYGIGAAIMESANAG